MRALTRFITILTAAAISGVGFAEELNRFDGKWTTVVSCPAAQGAESFTILVDAEIKSGVFSGQKGEQGKPGWYS